MNKRKLIIPAMVILLGVLLCFGSAAYTIVPGNHIHVEIPTPTPKPTPTVTATPTPTFIPTPTPELMKPLKIRITQTGPQIIPSTSVRIGDKTIVIPETTVRLKTSTREEANKYIAIFEPEYSVGPGIPIPTKLPIPNLKVTTETTVRGRNLTLIITIENTGDAEARNINLSVNKPPELQRISLTGAYATLDEPIIKWKGEKLGPGDTHVINYKLQFAEEPKEDLEFPMSLSWEDIYGNEWWMEFILTLLLKLLQEIPGFEAIFVIIEILVIYLIRRRR